MKSKLRTVLSHLNFHAPILVWLPGLAAFVLCLLWLVGRLTGRDEFQPSDPSTSADVLVQTGYRCVTIVLALICTWLVKTQESLNRTIAMTSGWQVYVASRAQTVALIALFLYVLTH